MLRLLAIVTNSERRVLLMSGGEVSFRFELHCYYFYFPW
jgi:hypothetical protein